MKIYHHYMLPRCAVRGVDMPPDRGIIGEVSVSWRMAMKTETTGTVMAGILTLDQPLDLPDQSRVRVAVEPLEGWQPGFSAGLDAWKASAGTSRACRRTTILTGPVA